MTHLSLRQYHPEDHDAVWDLHNVSLQAVGAHLGNDLYDDLHHIETVYLQNAGEFFVGIYDGRLVAMGALKRTLVVRAEVKRMRVSLDCQRRGFGQTMLTALEGRARELGYRTLHLDTSVVQLGAQRLYEKNGYVEVRRGMIGRLECIFYEKVLIDLSPPSQI